MGKDNITSKLFPNEDDHKQFELIYMALSSHELIRDENIPSVFIKSISEYATGSIVNCDNYTECKTEILILNRDKLQSNDNRDFYYFDPKQKSHESFEQQGADNGHNGDNSDEGMNEIIWHDIFRDTNTEPQVFCNECCKKIFKSEI